MNEWTNEWKRKMSEEMLGGGCGDGLNRWPGLKSALRMMAECYTESLNCIPETSITQYN